ncbi:Neuroendocrine convertase 1, partial [Fragariocoptes setiger]
MRLFVACFLICLLNTSAISPVKQDTFVDKWTVEINGNSSTADTIATQIGCINRGLVKGFDNIYLFERPSFIDRSSNNDEDPNMIVQRAKREFVRTTELLSQHAEIDWVEPQTTLRRVKRDPLSTIRSLRLAGTASPVDDGPQDWHEHRAYAMTQQQQQQQQQTQNQQNYWQTSLPQQKQQQQQQQPQQQQQIQSKPKHQPHQVIKSNAKQVYNHHIAPDHRDPFERGSASQFPSSDAQFNDELWMHQWYLQDTSNIPTIQGLDLNVQRAWDLGYSGQGIVVTVIDDGLEWNHTDLFANYDPRASWDMNSNDSDPFPRYDPFNQNSHGTRCAGEIAMVANNRKCGVGIAPRARIGGIRSLDGDVSDHIESMSILHSLDYVDIYSGSWGPMDDGATLEGPKRLAAQALERGIRHGRRGLGSLYIWANGNGGIRGDNCNCDGYVSSLYTISIGSVSQQGQFPFYGERCASTLAVTCSSGAFTDKKIATTDLRNKCTTDYSGTSAAAPLAAGIMALVLEANNNITWRDAQHLVAWTSEYYPLKDNQGWKRNAAGLLYNARFGFGLMNAGALVEAARSWTNVPKRRICTFSSRDVPRFLQSQTAPVYVAFHTDNHAACRYVEHVQVFVDIEYTRRGVLDIYLISPSGSWSTLLTRRPRDQAQNGFNNWPLMSVHFWGERSEGQWTLIVRDRHGQNQRGFLRNATLVLHGTQQRPAHMANGGRVYAQEDQIGDTLDASNEFDEDDMYDQNSLPNDLTMVRDEANEQILPPALVNLP